MSNKEEHLEELRGLTHTDDKKDHLGCISRHVDFKNKKWTDCNYRKNALDYSIANETSIYNVPNLRSSQRWLDFTLEYLEPMLYASSNKTKAGKVRYPNAICPVSFPKSWDLDHKISDTLYNPDGDSNFHVEKMPYVHQTHHIIACDEIYRAFTEVERRILVTSEYNINRKGPNVMILPKQRCIAWALKLPVHCPDKANHKDYSEKLRSRLAKIKKDFKENAEEDGHKITQENSPDLVDRLDEYSKQLREYIIDKGNKDPGVNLDNLVLPALMM